MNCNSTALLLVFIFVQSTYLKRKDGNKIRWKKESIASLCFDNLECQVPGSLLLTKKPMNIIHILL